MRFLLLEGPNLDAVGRREPEIYPTTACEDALAALVAWAAGEGIDLSCRQLAAEDDLVAALLGAAGEGFAGVVLNPGALSHSSLPLRDAAAAARVRVVEAHLTAVHGRPEPWRRRLVVAGAGHPLVTGLGYAGYRLALLALLGLVQD